MPQDNTTISSAAPAPYVAVRGAAGIAASNDRGWIVVSGNDRAAYLQGLLTNDIAALGPGGGCYSCYLTAQGRMITDLAVYEFGDVILLSLGRDVKDDVLAKLDQFIFSEDVQLGDVTGALAAFVVIGPMAGAATADVLGLDRKRVEELGAYGNLRAEFAGHVVMLLSTRAFGVPALEVLIDREQGPALHEAFVGRGVAEIDREALDVVRIESGVPAFHQDMDEETIPLEAGLEASAISFSKGCYVGQEVIVRVLHRGHGRVSRRLVGIASEAGGGGVLAGPIAAVDGHEIGRVTSAAFSPTLRTSIALGYVQRDYIEPGTKVSVGGAAAVVTKLPFVQT